MQFHILSRRFALNFIPARANLDIFNEYSKAYYGFFSFLDNSRLA